MTDADVIADVIAAAVDVATASLRERMAALEARALVPGPAGERGERGAPGADGASGRDGIDGKDGEPGPAGARGEPGEKGTDGKDGRHGADGTSGRDGQPGVPGAPGRDGAAGEKGEKGDPGKDGRDGTLESASLEQLDERTFRLLRADGSALGVVKFPVVLDRGVFQTARIYEKGDGVTYGGSFWIAQGATDEKPGDGATKWRLAVKAGRDGREGKPGKDGVPGPKGERGDPGRNFS